MMGLWATLLGMPAHAQSPIDELERMFTGVPIEARRLTGPLFWLHGDESRERLEMYVGKVAEGGNGCFTAESRPHSDWLGEGWFRDLGICLEAAKRHNLDMWIFDEEWWPSGEAGGRVPAEHASKKLEVAVLVNRSHTQFPVTPTYTGYALSTTLTDHVEVVLGKQAAVYLK